MKRPSKKELKRIRKRVARKLTKKEQRRVRKVVEQTICLLRAMSGGQGSVLIEVFDAGAGGGFQSARWFCDWLRDGMSAKGVDLYDPKILRDSLMALIAEDYWLIGKRVLRGEWR